MNKTDLKQISDLLDSKLEEKLEQKFEEKLAPIYKELKKHGKQLKSLKKDQDVMLKMLNREQMDQRKRLKRVENHLGLPAFTS